MSNDLTICTTPRTGAFRGITVTTNSEGCGIFTRRPDWTLLQHAGTGATPVFRSSKHLAAWLRRHHPDN
jgi:hypothetical protein